MTEIKIERTQRWHTLVKALGITALVLLMLVNIAGAAPFAYITNSGDNTVSVIDTATNTVTATVPVGNHPFGVAVSPDGRTVYVTNEYSNTVSVIDTTTTPNTVKSVTVGNGPSGIAITHDGRKVYVANRDSNTVSVIDTATNSVIATVNNIEKWPLGVAISPDGTTVYVVCADYQGNVSAIDAATNTVTKTGKAGREPSGVAVSPDGTTLYVACFDMAAVTVLNTDLNYVTYLPVRTKSDGMPYPFEVAFSPDGKKAYTTNTWEDNFTVIDTATKTLTAIVNVGSYPRGFSFTPDRRKVYVVNEFSNNVSVINTTTNTVTATINVGKYPVAYGQFIVPAPSNLYNINVVGTNYQYKYWGQYPSINLFGETYVPLFSNGNPIWKSHVDKVAKIVIDSKHKYTIKTGKKLDLGKGYSLKVKQIDVDGKKVWLEFDKDGKYVDDQIVSTDTGDNTWTCTLNNIQGVDNVPVLKVHVNKILRNTVQIDGLWLIDYANAKTIKVGDVFGKFVTRCKLTKIINGVDASFLGELVFKKYH